MKNMPDEKVAELYTQATPIETLQQLAGGVSRQAVYDCLKRQGISPDRKALIKFSCEFCGEMFIRRRSRVFNPQDEFNYCSRNCYHATKLYGGLGVYGGAGLKVQEELGYEFSPSKHYLDGDQLNDSPENIHWFPTVRAHMEFHHRRNKDNTIRNKKP